MTRYERGWNDAIRAAVKLLQEVNVSPEEAVAHVRNAGAMIEHLHERGDLSAPKPEPK